MSGGLTSAEAARRLAEHGPNELAREEGASPWRILIAQFRSAMVVLLVAAALISLALGEKLDAIAISAILVLNALVGFAQEYRAEKAVLALRAMTAPRARVLRDGRATMIPAREVAVGDALLLEAGDLVAADARLLEAHDLENIEASLTGESLPVVKSATPCAPNAPLAERHDSVFMGTSVARGTGTAEVIATGMATEMGRIAHLLTTAESGPTPLQRRLSVVGRILVRGCLAIVALVFVLGLARRLPVADVLLSAISLAVAAVPEGLAVIVTIALAIGVQRMAGRNVLVRKLPSVETLGCTTIICTDKTGTLTRGVMALRETWGRDRRAILDTATACADAELDGSSAGGSGDPTEVAILLAAAEDGIHRADIERERPRVDVHPFDAERKRMSILRADGRLHVKGALESVLPLCVAADPAVVAAHDEMASRGLRVLAVAIGDGPVEAKLQLLGLIGLADPPRAEAIEAIAAARAAGIRTVMITGDHPQTALAIAREMGIVREGEDPAEFVHARATPEDKIRVVRLWKERGAVVAMTGDGVNDAPALREADVGIAMGRTGTEVTREASDMILTDDNFSSIVAAVREGRGIYENIQKTLVYLLSGNVGELAVMLGAALLGLPLPLLALQLLWINLVTDGLPALALVMDPADSNLLRQPPRPSSEPLLGRPQWMTIVATGLLDATVTLAAFAWALSHRSLDEARDMAFSVLVFIELFRAFSARSRTHVFWQVGPLGNLKLVGVVAVSILLQIALHHVPWAWDVLSIGPLTARDCLLSLGLGLVPVTILECWKLARGAWSRGKVLPAR